jgi:hypothetical protein
VLHIGPDRLIEVSAEGWSLTRGEHRS